MCIRDSKSGSPHIYRNLEDDPVQAGRLLQLPVYALGARAYYGIGAGAIESRYWFTREASDSNDRFAGYHVDDQVEARFRHALATILDGIAAGIFIAAPGNPRQDRSYEHCQWCPYDMICSRTRGREFDLKSRGAALAEFHALTETEVNIQDKDS